MTLLLSSEVSTEGVYGASPSAVGGVDSGSYETIEVVWSALDVVYFEVNTTPGMATDDMSGDEACAIATVVGPDGGVLSLCSMMLN